MARARAETGSDSLATYRAKRNFKQTSEPEGSAADSAGARYLIQKHDATRLHYDFRLELDGVLKSWAVTRGPSLDPAQKRLAVRTEDHPISYGDFEGTIPEGNYGAGTVMLWDRGTWEPIGDPHQGLEQGSLKFILHGEKLHGSWALVRMHGDGSRKDQKHENWLLIKHDDEATDREHDILQDGPLSVKTGRDLSGVAEDAPPVKRRVTKALVPMVETRRQTKRGLPGFVEPALCTLVDEPPAGPDWLIEMKFDGYRALIAADGDAVRIYTRNGLDWTDRFGPIAQAVRKRDFAGVLLDGEIVVMDQDGHSDFGALQAALDGSGGELCVFVFDLLVDGGRSIADQPLRERKARLKELLGSAPPGRIYYSEHVEGDRGETLKTLCAQGFEGIVAKRAGAPYRSGRGHDWLKIKCGRRQELVIAGFSPSDKGRPFSSLLLGVRKDGELRYAGRVGSGFSQELLDGLARRFKPLIRHSQPFDQPVPGPIGRSATWLEPKLVAEIGFAGFTRDNQVRQGHFIGLREDKPAADIAIEEAKPVEKVVASARAKSAAPVRVRLTHPQKLLYPAESLSKEDVARYLEAVAPFMFPYIERRLLSLVRCPEGQEKECFFQRHPTAQMPTQFKPFPLRKKTGGSETYLYGENEEAIAACAQIGVLEIHGWGSRIDAIEKPDRLVFDLDPAEDVPFTRVRDAAKKMREALQAIELESFSLLTGGKGIHVVVPLEPDREWPEVKAFARGLAEHFVTHEPDSFIATMSKAKRVGKIFIDHFRNERGATAIMPFSPRANPGAPVAWPINWEELREVTSASAVSIAHLGERDPALPWRGYFKTRQRISDAAMRAVAKQ